MKDSFVYLKNFRDFSGYRCVDGTTLRGDTFARSDNPREISEEEIDELRKRGFTTVIDLRRENEKEVFPDQLSFVQDFKYHPIIMNDVAYTDLGVLIEPKDIAAAYYGMLGPSRDRIAAIFRILAVSESGVLFHCEAGKDRTGTIAALLLLLCDVEDATIAEDYRLSYDCLYYDGGEYVSEPTLVPQKETMEFFLKRFHEDYPIAADYFRGIGLSENEIRQIRNKIKK